jgi:putative DNA primase/helicase
MFRPMTEEEIIAAPAIAISIACKPAEAPKRLAEIPPPTALINTGKALAAIYAFSSALPIGTATQLGRHLANRVDGQQAWLIPLPGSVRTSGAQVKIIHYHAGKTFSPADLAPVSARKRKVVRASDVAPANIDWLWKHMIPKGELTIIAGFGSAGKTTMCLGLAATITQGGAWPDGTPAPKGRALVIEGEDPVDTVTVPRLLAAGADLDRVTLVDQGEDMLTAADLDEAAAGIDDLRLVVLSPIRRLIHDNQAGNTEIRSRLEPLIVWAKARGCALVGVMHPQKGNRSQRADALAGSPAYTELARAVHLAAIDEIDEEPVELLKRRVLTSVKANLAPAGIQYCYRIESAWAGDIETSRVIWIRPGEKASPWSAGPEQNGTFPVRSAEPHRPPAPIYKTNAEAWLAARLADGPRFANELETEAKTDGISQRTLYRAATSLRVTRVTAPNKKKLWQMRNR